MEKPEDIIIVELNGLAGCGKTTLITNAKELLKEKGYQVLTLPEISRLYKRNKFANTFRSFSLRIFIIYMRLFLNLKKVEDTPLFSYLAAIRICLLYRWCLKNQSCHYILIDHGIIQNFASIIGFQGSSISKKTQQVLLNLMQNESDFYIVNCDLEPKDAVKRIRQRNRFNEGRLDAISNDEALLRKLWIYQNNLLLVRGIALKANRSINSTLNMNNPADQLKNQFVAFLLTLGKGEQDCK